VTRPRPEPDATSEPYFAACADGELLIQRCPECGHRQHYPRPICIRCGATPEWERASGRGVVHTFTVIRQHGLEPFASEAPYVVAIVELAEGPRLMGNVLGVDPDAVTIGLAVECFMMPIEEGVVVPNWRPVPA
jgi:uncharacterized OB-fold protein